MLLGSTAVSLAAHSHCPVLVVREDPDGTGPVVLAVDGSPEGEKAVEFAFAERGCGEPSSSPCTLPDQAPAGTGVESPERLPAQAVVGRAERYPDVTVRQEVLSGETREALSEASGNAQLMVADARGRGGFSGMLLGSVGQALPHHAHCPVAVVRRRA